MSGRSTSTRWAVLVATAIALVGGCGGQEPAIGGVCQMRMFDRANSFETTLQVLVVDDTELIVTARLETFDPWSVKVMLLPNGGLEIDAGVPQVTQQGLLALYPMKNHGALTFVPVDGHPCREFDRALIFFLVLEWFFYG